MKDDTATESTIQSRQEAACVVKQLAHFTALLGAAVASQNMDVLAAQEKHSALIKQISSEITAGESKLQAWANANREAEFGEAQSIEFTHGFLRFRMGSRKLDFLARWDEAKVLVKLLSFPVTSQWAKYIRRTPELNKQLLLVDTKDGGKAPALPPALLKTVGLKIVREERFEVEVKPEMAIADVVNRSSLAA